MRAAAEELVMILLRVHEWKRREEQFSIVKEKEKRERNSENV